MEAHCDAVDINFGCPQNIAKSGRYGAYLCEDWDLIHRLSERTFASASLSLPNSTTLSVNILHQNLSIPVTAKFRIFSDMEKTVKYAQMMERAGAQILTCHGRTREQKGHNAVRTQVAWSY